MEKGEELLVNKTVVEHNKKQKLWYLLPIGVLVFGLLAVLMLLSINAVRAKQHQNSILMGALMDVQINISVFHVWYEEYINGEEHVDINSAWATLDRAITLNDIMLQGGETEHGFLTRPLNDPQMRSKAESVRSLIHAFKEVSIKRLTVWKEAGKPLHAHSGSEHLNFDNMFENTIKEAKVLEEALKEDMKQNQTRSQHLFWGMLTAWLTVLIFAVTGFWRIEKRRKVVEENLRQKSEELEVLTGDLRRFSSHLSKEEELSRRKFAKILHEQVGQDLTAVMIKCDRILEKTGMDVSEIKKAISSLNPLLTEALRSTRELTSELYPSIIDDLGFIPAVTWYRDIVLGSIGLNVFLDINKSVEHLPIESKVSLFRIVQESFQNIAKHASASEVKIAFKNTKNTMELSIKDNGCGLDKVAIKKKRSKGIGLLLMKERALSLGGEFKLKSVLNEGTEILVEIPLIKEK